MDSNVKIALNMDDGTVAIMTFCTQGRSPTLPSGAAWLNDNSGRWARPPTDENIKAELAKALPGVNSIGKKKAKPLSFSLVEHVDIPADRTYRNALRFDGRTFTHDLDHCKRIHAERIRRDRAAALAALDGKWMRATGRGDKAEQDAVEAERQKWRDAPADPRIDAAQSVEELKQIKVA